MLSFVTLLLSLTAAFMGLHHSGLLCALSGNLKVTVFLLLLPVLALARQNS